MSDYQPLDETEAATLKAQPHLGEGYESECLPGWIESFGRWHREGEGKELNQGAVSSLAHTLIAARRRNWLMADEIRRLQAENAELKDELAESLWDAVAYGGIRNDDGSYDSCCLTGVVWSMTRLIELGKAVEVGERVGRNMTIRAKGADDD